MRHTLLCAAQVLNLNCLRFLGRRSVKPGAIDTAGVGTSTAKSAGEGAVARTGALHSEGLSHDGAAPGEHLEVGHAASARGDMVARRCRGKRAQSRGRRLVEERAHGPRLAQNRLHDGQISSGEDMRRWERLALSCWVRKGSETKRMQGPRGIDGGRREEKVKEGWDGGRRLETRRDQNSLSYGRGAGDPAASNMLHIIGALRAHAYFRRH